MISNGLIADAQMSTSCCEKAKPAFFRTVYTASLPGKLLKSLGLGLVCVVVSNCTLIPNTLPTTRPEVIIDEPDTRGPAIESEEQEVITHAIENDERIIKVDDPWDLLEQADAAADSDAPALLIRAINEFINRGQQFTAQSVVERLKNYSLTSKQKISLQIIQSRLANASGDYVTAITLLGNINHARMQDVGLKKQVLQVLVDSQLSLGRLSDTATSLLELDSLVINEEQLANQRQLLELLQSMDALHLSLLKEYSSDPSLEGWLALADTLKVTTPALRQTDLQNWRLAYPNHPAQPGLLAHYTDQEEFSKYRQIALLLPLTSPYGSAARAFYDGFMRAHKNSYSAQPPRVILYDIGDESYLSSFYYQAAVNEGADFVVGPLGRAAADALLSARQPEITTLLIAEIPPDKIADNLYGISLSPVKEAEQVADKAFADGHRRASIFRSDSEWGGRVANAFISRWEVLGGTIVKNSSFPSDVSDYTNVIQRFLGLNKSTARHRLLEAQVETSLEFTPRRNEDMDLIFLGANAEQSRLVVPQLRFFQAHDLPIYATSYVYSGEPNPGVDADLDGLIFGDMKWMLGAVTRYKAKIAEEKARKAADLAVSQSDGEPVDENMLIDPLENNADTASNEEAVSAEVFEESGPALSGASTLDRLESPETSGISVNPYQSSTLNRLYALGLQSYQLIPRLKNLRTNNWDRFLGEAMTVRVDSDGSVVRIPVWMEFVSGLAEPIKSISAPYTEVSPSTP